MKFDNIIMNPPYQRQSKGGNGARDLWHKFIPLSFSLCKADGYMAHIHPSKWRKPQHPIWNLLTKKQIEFLSIHNLKEGKAVFNATTRFDWYIIKNIQRNKETIVRQENKEMLKIDMGSILFLPNYGLKEILNIIALDGEEKCEVLYKPGDYGCDRKWMSEKETEKYKHPCVYGMYKDLTIKCLYSSKKKGHFGVSKVIVSMGQYPYPLIDMEGKYGMCNNAFAIVVSSREEAEGIKKALNSSRFKEILKSTKWLNFQIDYKMFKYFRKDFYKMFEK